jgi:hypothetical protein
VVLVGYVAGEAECSLTGRDQSIRGGVKCLVVKVGEHNGGARVGEDES